VDSQDADVLDYLEVLWRWRGLIAVGTAVCVLATAAVTWWLPRTYRMRAVVEIGELSEERVKDVERVVARLTADGLGSAGDAAGSARLGLLTVEYRKPYRIDVAADTTVPPEAGPVLEGLTRKLVEDLQRVAESQRADEQAATQVLRQEVDLALAQIRGELDRRIEVVKRKIVEAQSEDTRTLIRMRAWVEAGLEAARKEARAATAALRELERQRGVDERRLGELETQLGALRKVRDEALAGGKDLPGALLHGQLSRELFEREDAAAAIRAGLAALPARLEEARARDEAARVRLAALEQARTLVADRRVLDRPQDLETAWGILWRFHFRDRPDDGQPEARPRSDLAPPQAVPGRVKGLTDELRLLETAVAAARRQDGAPGGELDAVRAVVFTLMTPGSAEASTLERAVRRIEIEIPEKHRALKRQIERGGQGAREVRLLVAPQMPGTPIRPRVLLNLAAGVVAGLVGSVLLAFVAEYVGQARRRRETSR
jgi:hypothetical protein